MLEEEPAKVAEPGLLETDKSAYYEKFYQQILKRRNYRRGTTETIAIDGLPKGHGGEINWSAAVVEGYINPRGSLDPNEPEEELLNLNIFIEAKTPLMANVIFPHSIHTYWLSCKNCHPGIFIPQAGANPITMNEIFEGKWCGRCHGKVAFNFFPLANCRRCHIVMKGQSMDKERWR
jgi:c(7)-type cytochrome triheme protein